MDSSKAREQHSPDSLRIARALGIEVGTQKQNSLLKHLAEVKDPEKLFHEVEILVIQDKEKK